MTWRTIQKENFTQWKELAAYLQLDASVALAKPRFSLNVPRRLAAKMQKNTLNDPIFRQFIPLKEELDSRPGFCSDAVGDLPSRREKKLLHKYHGRALLLCTSACAMHCRYCFRQNFPYETESSLFEAELEAIAADPSITEILLSGGDPLSLSDRALGDLLERLDAIPYLQRLRFHTRFPIGIPERIDDSFLSLLKKTRLQVFFVIHCNRAEELDPDVFAALKKVQGLGIPILTQTVLLKGVNDSVGALKELMEAFINHGILPYYLHHLDKVEGSAHFEVSEEEGLRLLKELSKQLPGYALPRYVKEIAGEPSKTLLW